jgi:hypothetical protein
MAGNRREIGEYAVDDNGGAGSGGAIDPASLAGAAGGDNGGGGGDDDFDPAIHVGRNSTNADGSYRRKRGRKSATGSAKAAPPVSVSGIEAVLVSLHTIAATVTRTPELVLDGTEAEAMAKSIAEVAKHYPTNIDPKLMAWVNLSATSAMIYGPRLWLIRDRKDKERRPTPAPDPQFSFPPPAFVPG